MQVLSKSEEHMPYRTVQDVMVKQGIFEQMFGLATVSIRNAGASQAVINIPGQTLEGANKIADIVRSISLTRSSARTGL